MNNLRYYRLKVGLTVKDFAEEIGCSIPLAYALENGNRNSDIWLNAISEVLHIPSHKLKCKLKRVKKIKVQSRLRELRQRAKKTLEEVQLGAIRHPNLPHLSRQYLSLLEHGKRTPSPKIQNALADYFSDVLKKNITPQKLFPVVFYG